MWGSTSWCDPQTQSQEDSLHVPRGMAPKLAGKHGVFSNIHCSETALGWRFQNTPFYSKMNYEVPVDQIKHKAGDEEDSEAEKNINPLRGESEKNNMFLLHLLNHRNHRLGSKGHTWFHLNEIEQ